MSSEVRKPAVAGRFYPRAVDELESMVDEFLRDVEETPRAVLGAVVPHAGLIYSGRCAAQVFGRIEIPELVVIIAPNHTGRLGTPGGASGWSEGWFETPLGRMEVDSEFMQRLSAACHLVEHDPSAHLGEHAIEVELPFLQFLDRPCKIAPLVLAWDDWEHCKLLADGLVETIRSWKTDVLLLASSDMTHYEPAERAAIKDRLALDAMEELDGSALLEVCRKESVTMCGRAPAAVVLETARMLGAKCAEVVDYRNSGRVTGDYSSVVAYAGLVIPN